MIQGLILLLLFQWVGEYLFHALPFKIPGAVWGLMLLTCALAIWGKPVPKEMETPGRYLIRYLGLLFIPAGVGIMNHLGQLQSNLLPILAGLVGSTILCLLVTGVLMQRLGKPYPGKGRL